MLKYIVKKARRPTEEQTETIKAAALDPFKWMTLEEDDHFLYLVDRGIEQRQAITIDKSTLRII